MRLNIRRLRVFWQVFMVWVGAGPLFAWMAMMVSQVTLSAAYETTGKNHIRKSQRVPELKARDWFFLSREFFHVQKEPFSFGSLSNSQTAEWQMFRA
jgi:hypothetical protein